MPSIVTISGTSRPNNYTKKALGVVEEALRARGAEVVSIDACELDLSFPGYPDTADSERMRQAIRASTGVVLATPEYHGTFSAMLKLILENLGFPSALKGKPVALLGVASGRIGAIKSLEQLRGVAAHIGAIVLPGSVSVAGVRKVFDAEGRCTDPQTKDMLEELGTSLVDYVHQYVCPRHELESMVREQSGRPWTANV